MASTTILSDNGASSGSAGLKSTAGNDGVLILQTTTSGGTATNAVYVDTSQQLGFNTSSPAARLHANDTMASSTTYQTEMILQAQPASGSTGTSSAGGVQLLFRGTTDGAIANSTLAAVVGFVQTVSVNNAGGLAIRCQESAGSGLVDSARFSAGGLISLRGATNVSSGTGIAFPASQSTSSDANTLDDYEEGTWTPVDVSGAGLSFSSANGYYTKIGNLVSVQMWVQFPVTASGTSCSLGGLPFGTASGNNRYSTSIFWTDSNLTMTAAIGGSAGSTGIQPRSLTNATIANSSLSNKFLICSFSYMAS